MRRESLTPYVAARPFRPFRLVMNSGHALDIRHPEMINVGRDVALVFHPDRPGEPFETWDTVSLLLIERIIYLDASASTPN